MTREGGIRRAGRLMMGEGDNRDMGECDSGQGKLSFVTWENGGHDKENDVHGGRG